MTPKRVLIIEDSEDAAAALAFLLQAAGHIVEVASSGNEGIAKTLSFRPQIVLCDLRLPGLDGYGVARALRSDPQSSGVTLIALSGFSEDEDRALAIGAGFDHHLGKPFQPDALLRLVGTTQPADPAD